MLRTEVLGGAYGNNVGLTTERGAWVLRGVVPPLEPAVLRRERFFARMIYDRSSVKAPWPYLIDDLDDIFGWPYAIMRRLPGKVLHPGLDLRWSPIGRALGHTVAELHAITFRSIGAWQPDVDDIVNPGVSSADWFARRVSDLVARIAETSSAIDDTSRALIDASVMAALPALGGFTPTDVHGDLGSGNLVGDRSGNGFTFTGVFDLGGGYAGDPDEDLATPLWWPLYWQRPDAATAFLDGYRVARAARPGQPVRLRAYVIASMLSNWESGRRQRLDWYGGAETFSAWAQPLLEQVDAIVGV